jgi:hypothetical protein
MEYYRETTHRKTDDPADGVKGAGSAVFVFVVGHGIDRFDDAGQN